MGCSGVIKIVCAFADDRNKWGGYDQLLFFGVLTVTIDHILYLRRWRRTTTETGTIGNAGRLEALSCVKLQIQKDMKDAHSPS
jgi:hypothetical protein